MTVRIFSCCMVLSSIIATAASFAAQPDPMIPHLEKRGTVTQLIVDGKPYLALAGELNNSSASNLDYVKPLWPRFVATHINTVLATVSWELMEPEEGKFDFSLVDGLINDARANDLHLMLLWFGSWKNGKSTYQPLWSKTNQQRFPLAQDKKGRSLPTLTTLSDVNRDADARAFAALMRHIREVDGTAHTVLMMQVENEVGLLGDTRDYSPAANKAFTSPVPKEFMDHLQKNKDTLIPELRKRWEAAGFKTSGTWEEVFGAGIETDELFMAWNYARYVGAVAAAGKAEYPLPMYVNAWLVQNANDRPGNYPCGGPLAQVMDAWHAGAPAIDILSPDVHVPNFTDWCTWYTQGGNPLFIPESRGDALGMANAIWAIGKLNAIGYSPFGIDRLAGADTELGRAYEILAQVAPLILEAQSKGTMTAVQLGGGAPATVRLGNYNIEFRSSGGRGGGAGGAAGGVRGAAGTRGPAAPADAAGGVTSVALLISTAPDDFVIVTRGAQVYFSSVTDPSLSVALAVVEEGKYVSGRWVPGRRLNGDETPEWRAMRFPADNYSIQRVKLYTYR